MNKSVVESHHLMETLGETVQWKRAPSDWCSQDVLDSLSASVEDALTCPVDFPSVTQAVIPGDQVVIAVDAMVPRLADLVVAVSRLFADSDLGSFEVVLSAEASDDLMMDVAAALGKTATVSRHDSARRESLMYLMADASGEPIYLNRKIVDADFVLPIQAAYPGGTLDRLAVAGTAGLFPTFADSAAQRRLRQSADDADELKLLQRDLGMTLGVQVLLQVHVESGGGWKGFRCGTLPASSPSDDQKAVQPSSEYIVCCVDGDVYQQSWANLARAASSVLPHVDETTTVVFWSSIQEAPSDRFRLAMLRDHAAADGGEPSLGGDPTLESDEIRTDVLNGDGFPASDMMEDVAAVLGRLRDRCRVVLRSEVDDEMVEELGFGVIQDADELGKLIKSGSSCGLILGAQFCGTRILR